MPQLERIGSWTKVPHGSRLHVALRGTTAGNLVTGRMFVIRDDGFEQTIPDSALQPGPKEIVLEFPHIYSLMLDLHYATAGVADVTASVTSPGGNVVPQDGAPPPKFASSITGTEGQGISVIFFLTTGPT